MTDNTSKKAHDLADDAAETVGDLAEQAHELADDAGKKARDLADDAAKKAGDLADQARSTVDDTVKKAGEFADQARHSVDDAVTAATDAIHKFDLDGTAENAITSTRVLVAEGIDKLSAAYKRNPALVLTIGSVAVATVATIAAQLAKRR